MCYKHLTEVVDDTNPEEKFAQFGRFTFIKCTVFTAGLNDFLIPDPFPLFQGIPGVHGKKGKMGRPVKFSLNIFYRNADTLS